MFTLLCYLWVWYSLNLPSPVTLFVKRSITWHQPRLVWTEARESGKQRDFHRVLETSLSSLVAKCIVNIKVSFQLPRSCCNTQFLRFINKILFLSNSPSSNINTADKSLTVPLELCIHLIGQEKLPKIRILLPANDKRNYFPSDWRQYNVQSTDMGISQGNRAFSRSLRLIKKNKTKKTFSNVRQFRTKRKGI